MTRGGTSPDLPAFRTAAVLGLGLMGGSLARDLAALGVEVWGYDADDATLAAAVAEGVVSVRLDSTLEGVADADVVILAVPMDVARDLLPRVAGCATAARLITDLGSTKAGIARAAEECGLGLRFVGTHPLAGDHLAGWQSSRRGLFAGARVYVCPGPHASAAARGLAEDLWRGVGGDPMVMHPAEHDRTMAWVSHLPQVVSTALALALAGAGHPRGELGPGGWDTTRLAGSSPSMWVPVALDNADELSRAVNAIEDRLAALRGALARRDEAGVQAFFSEGRVWFQP